MASSPHSPPGRQDAGRWVGRNRAAFYRELLVATNAGPFDGGCVVVAQALHLKYGGEIVVLARADGVADHAALRLDDRYLDGDGMATSAPELLARFNTLEMGAAVSVRPLQDKDLPDAPRGLAVARRLAALLPKHPPAPQDSSSP